MGATIMRHGARYLSHLAKLCIGKAVVAPRKVAADYVVLGSEYCAWPLLPAMMSSHSIVYSFGVGENISFDLAAIERFHCQIYAFDPTPRSVNWMRGQSTPREFHFHELGIGAEPGEMLFHPPRIATHVSYTISERRRLKGGEPVRAEVLDLSSIMQRLHHTRVDVLKMDVEGAEYAVIEGLGRQRHFPAQLMVEFHHGMYGYTAKDTREAINTLGRDGYDPYYVSEAGREFGFVRGSSALRERSA